VGPEDEIEMREAAEQRVAHLLGDTASDAHDAPRPLALPLAQLAEVAVELMLRPVPDRAGVDHEDVRLGLARTRFETGIRQQRRDLLRVMDVHLAAVGADGVALAVQGIFQG
jgi:hypothetical protein